MDAITLLTTDHRKVEGLFKDYESASDPRIRKDLVDTMSKELSIHAGIEEEGFYPQIKDKIPGGESLVEESLHEHQQVKEVLAQLERMEPSNAAYHSRVQSLISDVKHHVQEEESELFPKVRSACTASELQEMGKKLEEAKSHAPTHPHPMAPSRGMGGKAAGMMAGAMDRARDAMGGRKEDHEVRGKFAKKSAGEHSSSPVAVGEARRGRSPARHSARPLPRSPAPALPAPRTSPA